MTTFRTLADGVGKKLEIVAEVAIVCLMLLSCADVVLRLFGTPIKGVYDLVSITASAAVCFALAHTGTQRAHVSVTFVTDRLPHGMQVAVFGVTRLVSAVFFALLAWESVVYGNQLRASGEVSLTLRMPFYPFVYGIALGAAALVLVLLADVMANTNAKVEQEIV